MTGFTEQQLADLAAPLARENVVTRQRAGMQLSYLEGWRVIAEANRIFGFDGWDRETIECRCVSEAATQMGRPPQVRDGWKAAYVGKVRVTVRAGDTIIVREGTGYGSGVDADPGMAHESATKECETDALKRALMTFGNPFGLALYDKTQAEVAPMQKSPAEPAQQRNGSRDNYAMSDLTPQQAAPAEHPRRQEALDSYHRIRASIEDARTGTDIDGLLANNQGDIDLIQQVHAQSAMGLLRLALQRKREMFGATE